MTLAPTRHTLSAILPMLAALWLAALTACTSDTTDLAPQFVTVRGGDFYIGDTVYNFVGANFWYGAILASQGQGGDRDRLERELDLMQATGIDNLRVLVGGDGRTDEPSHIRPVLQPEPGVYNDTILDGLDYLMAQLEKRGMRAVLYLNNAWEWSGGYGTYLEWAGLGRTPDPVADGWEPYRDRVAMFVVNDSAKAMASRHVSHIVSRTNRYTGQPYSQSSALMAWEIANEPRAFARDSVTKEAYAQWLFDTADLIKTLDPNHLVATGSEGMYGTEVDLDLWARIHNSPQIDYAMVHVWPYNWLWIDHDDKASVVDSVDTALAHALEYITMHAQATDKPLVLEEFGYPRDEMAIAPGTPTTGRDRFYAGVFDMIRKTGLIDGCNIWAWGGYAQPAHEMWQPWDDYTGDPAQEPQGLNSVFATDSTTLAIIRNL